MPKNSYTEAAKRVIARHLHGGNDSPLFTACTPTNGKQSLMWRHPISLSWYRHMNATDDDNLKFYNSVTMDMKGFSGFRATSSKSFKYSD